MPSVLIDRQERDGGYHARRADWATLAQDPGWHDWVVGYATSDWRSMRPRRRRWPDNAIIVQQAIGGFQHFL